MKPAETRRALLAAAVVVIGAGAFWCLGTTRDVQAPGKTAALPTFEVDRAWPKVPAKWKLGDASSFAIDAQDNVWVLHRPRTLKPEQAAMAAPPVIVFDTAGNFIKAWGGAGSGYEWPEREHGIHVDYKGFVWIGGNNCPTNGLPGSSRLPTTNAEVHAGRQVRHADRPQQSEQGQRGHAEPAPRRGCVGASADQRTVRRRRLRQSPRRRVRRRHRRVQADVGRVRQQAGGRRPLRGGDAEKLPGGPGPQNFSIVHAIRVAKDGMVYVADRENRRVQIVHGRRQVREAAGEDRHAVCARPGVVAGLRSSSSSTSATATTSSSSIARRSRSSAAIKVPGMIGGGHQIATDSKGQSLYRADDARGCRS